ncbi:MAG: c-type cytochrome [Gemmatimonadales bacterium]
MNRGLARSGVIGVAVLSLSCGAGSERRSDHPPRLDPAVVEQGRQVYASSCAACHGSQGEGALYWRQPDARGELPAPPHNAEGHTWRHGNGMLYQIVRDGWRDPFNRTARLTMPAFRGQLTPAATRAVITYLKTWWRPEQRQFQWEESRQSRFPPDTMVP